MWKNGYLFPPSLFLILVALVDQEVVGHDVVRDTAQVDIVKTSCFVTSISGESFVAPGISEFKIKLLESDQKKRTMVHVYS